MENTWCKKNDINKYTWQRVGRWIVIDKALMDLVEWINVRAGSCQKSELHNLGMYLGITCGVTQPHMILGVWEGLLQRLNCENWKLCE